MWLQADSSRACLRSHLLGSWATMVVPADEGGTSTGKFRDGVFNSYISPATRDTFPKNGGHGSRWERATLRAKKTRACEKSKVSTTKRGKKICSRTRTVDHQLHKNKKQTPKNSHKRQNLNHVPMPPEKMKASSKRKSDVLSILYLGCQSC